jgi:hypothetical protein
MIPGREVDENYILLDYYTASSGNFFLTFGTDGLYLNGGKELPILAA